MNDRAKGKFLQILPRFPPSLQISYPRHHDWKYTLSQVGEDCVLKLYLLLGMEQGTRHIYLAGWHGYHLCVPGGDATKSAQAFGHTDTPCASRNVQELHIIGWKQNRLVPCVGFDITRCLSQAQLGYLAYMAVCYPTGRFISHSGATW